MDGGWRAQPRGSQPARRRPGRPCLPAALLSRCHGLAGPEEELVVLHGVLCAAFGGVLGQPRETGGGRRPFMGSQVVVAARSRSQF